jgi:DNA adenine methylase
MRPPFCRVGSKKPISQKIRNMIPPHKIYVEPFVGSGAIYWDKNPSDKEVLNDLDKQLMNNYKLLKRTKSGNFRTDLDSVDKIQKYVNKVYKTDADRLLKAVAVSCGTFVTGSGKGGIYRKSNPYNKLKNINEYQERMKNTTLLSQDYKTVIKNYDGPDTFFFLDPPYEKSTVLYKHGGFDFKRLKDTLTGIKGKFLLTLNDSSYIRDLFSNFKIMGITVKGRGNKGVGMGSRKELIIKNYV